MLRTLLLTLAGGLFATAPLTAQECESCPGCQESATVATTVSQDEPTALAKGLAALAKKPFSFDMKMTIKDGENGGTVDGNVAFGDSKHFAMKMNIAMKDGEQPLNAKVRLVADGTWLYFHIDSKELEPQMGGMNIGKIKLSAFDQITKMAMSESPMPVLDEKGNVNAATIDKALAQAGMKITRDDEKGIVNLAMEMPGMTPEGPGKMNIVLDGKNYLPKSIKMVASEKDGMTMSFSNGKVHKDIKEFGENAWKFEVPEGTVIADLTGMVSMMMPAPGAAEEELEF